MARFYKVMTQRMEVIEDRPVTVEVEASSKEEADAIANSLREGHLSTEETEALTGGELVAIHDHPDEDMERHVMKVEHVKNQTPNVFPVKPELGEAGEEITGFQHVVWDEMLPTNMLLTNAAKELGKDIEDIESIWTIDRFIPEERIEDVEVALTFVKASDEEVQQHENRLMFYQDNDVYLEQFVYNNGNLGLALKDVHSGKRVTELTRQHFSVGIGEAMLIKRPGAEGSKAWLEAEGIIPKQVGRIEEVNGEITMVVDMPLHRGVAVQLRNERQKWEALEAERKERERKGPPRSKHEPRSTNRKGLMHGGGDNA